MPASSGPPGFYGATRPPPLPPPMLYAAPSLAPAGPPPQMVSVVEIERRAAALRAQQAAAAPRPPPPPPPRRAVTLAELEASLMAQAAPPAPSPVPRPSPPLPLPLLLPLPRPLPLPLPQPSPVPPPRGSTERVLTPWAGGTSSGGPSSGAVPTSAPVPAPAGGGRKRYSSKYMTEEQCDGILRIQWAATHPSDVPAYTGDYYAQALAARASAAARLRFAPPDAAKLGLGAGSAAVSGVAEAFVALEGLGRVPQGSVRRPKPLLELIAAAGAEQAAAEGEWADGGASLETSPRVAVRLLVEDGFSALADADDLRRLAAAKPETADACGRKRRAVLESFFAALRLPLGASAGSDGVLIHVASLSKGRTLLAAIMRSWAEDGAHCSPQATALALALLRNVRAAFAPPRALPSSADGVDDASFHALAHACGALLRGWPKEGLPGAAAAVNAGGLPAQLDDLSPHGRGGAALLSQLLAAAAAAGLGGGDADWARHFAPLFASISTRIAPAVSAVRAAGGREARRAALRAVPLELLRLCLPHVATSDREGVARFLDSLGQ